MPKLKVVALYKTWRGDEFVIPSVESIYRHVDKIVMVHSNVSWAGERGNTVAPVLKEWQKDGDIMHKLVHLHLDLQKQRAQYDRGLAYIRDKLDADYVLIIDTDEVWDDDQIERLLEYVSLDRKAQAVVCRMRTYVKDVHYRIEPPEPCSPTVLVKADCRDFTGTRGNGVSGKVMLQNVYFHHFTFVRRDVESIREKIVLSNLGDGAPHVDVDKWMAEKWARIPDCTSLHMTRGAEGAWQSVKVVHDSELPDLSKARL